MSQTPKNRKAYEAPEVSILQFTFENTLGLSPANDGFLTGAPTGTDDWSND